MQRSAWWCDGSALGIFLVTEVTLSSVLSLTILVKGGGPDGLLVSAINR